MYNVGGQEMKTGGAVEGRGLGLGHKASSQVVSSPNWPFMSKSRTTTP